MKKLIKIIFLIFLAFNIFNVDAWYVNIPANSNISANSIPVPAWWDLIWSVHTIWTNILRSVKLIIQALAILFVVYIWIQMIISKWTDEEDLSSAKRQIYYTVIWLALVNIPWLLFDSFNPTSRWSINSSVPAVSWTTNSDYNIFFNVFNFWYTLNNNIIWYMEVIIAWIAILLLAYSWLKMMASRWREEKVNEWKNKIRYSILALIFIAFIESWKNFVFSWKIADGSTLFQTMSNLALFLAWPTVILFLTIAAYYYITANGDDEKIKKAKSIIINVLIASVLLLASYTFLLDLKTL